MIASRNVERLAEATVEMRDIAHENSPAEIDHVQCNIRKEEQVDFCSLKFLTTCTCTKYSVPYLSIV